MDSVATRLKALREAASPAVSIRELAELIGRDHSSYVHYENPRRFKKQFLPFDLARDIASVLGDRGIDPTDVMRLAGVGEKDPSIRDLTAGQERLLDLYDRLPAERRRLLVQVAEVFVTGELARLAPHNGRVTHGAGGQA